jgi:Uma2 family endonuclease
LVIEVADSSLEYDSQVKRPLYAKGGIAEFWLIDLKGQAIDAYSQPRDGTFENHKRFVAGDSIGLTSIPDAAFSVTDILG